MSVIKGTLVNHSYINEVQTVVQVFFPNSRFAINNTSNEPYSYHVISRIENQEVIGEIYKNDRLLAAYTVRPKAYINEKKAVMLSLFHALKQVFDICTPWGSLTGIRPSKLVRQWLDEGHQDNEIINRLIDPFCCHESKARLAVRVAHAEKRLTEKINGVGLYVSIPFCPSRCVYCSFNTISKANHEDYINALVKECKTKTMPHTITSVYIGGGTPTMLSEAHLYTLLEAIASVAKPIEYTVEAGRPDSLTIEKLRILREFGVNRIAVNPQTLHDKTLQRIGRSHTAADFYRAYEMVRAVGFACINTDIIAGLPGETSADMAQTLAGLMPLCPENITVHTLAVKRASKLNEHLTEYELNARETALMLDMASQACEENGLSPYYLYRQKNMVGLFENVGYSLPGHECLYNVGMMAETQTIIGIGAAAVCKYVDHEKITRTFNPKNTELYIEKMKG
jgi:oxygen-independent coproporphyrinogen-3 oxidase